MTLKTVDPFPSHLSSLVKRSGDHLLQPKRDVHRQFQRRLTENRAVEDDQRYCRSVQSGVQSIRRLSLLQVVSIFSQQSSLLATKSFLTGCRVRGSCGVLALLKDWFKESAQGWWIGSSCLRSPSAIRFRDIQRRVRNKSCCSSSSSQHRGWCTCVSFYRKAARGDFREKNWCLFCYARQASSEHPSSWSITWQYHRGKSGACMYTDSSAR